MEGRGLGGESEGWDEEREMMLICSSQSGWPKLVRRGWSD